MKTMSIRSRVFFLMFSLITLALTSCDSSSISIDNTTKDITVTWVNYDNTILEIDNNVEYGSLPSYDGETPKRESDDQYTYVFDSWTPKIEKVKNDITYKATYKIVTNMYTVTWMCGDKVLKIDEIPYGTIPSYEGETPTKEKDDQYTYKFSGWSPEIRPVDGNTIYYAMFDKTVNNYTITWKNYDGSILEVDQNAEYGTTPVFQNEDSLIKPNDSFYSYKFNGWSPKIHSVNANQEYIAQYEITGIENFYFEINETKTGYILTRYIGEDNKNILVPNYYRGLPVTKIGDYAFNNISINSLFIPKTIQTISYSAFSNITNIFLDRLEISKELSNSWDTFKPRVCAGICYIDRQGIAYKIENGKANIVGYCGDEAKIVIPSSINVDNNNIIVDSIDDYAFSNCSSLVSINIPSSVVSVGISAFYNCDSLTIYCEISAKPDGWSPFWNSSSQPVQWSSSVTNDSFAYSIKNSEITIIRYVGTDNNIIIPSSIIVGEEKVPVTAIGDSAFKNCTSLTKIDFPNSITTIGDSAFENCTSLTEIYIPSSVTTIGNNAFLSCVSLTTIYIPSSVTTIGNCAFDNCTSLTEIDIPNSITTIRYNTFNNCTSLTTIIIPSSVTTIGNYAFSGCTSLTTVFIPSSVTIIGDYAFSGCTSLTTIDIPSSVTTIGDSAFNNCESLIIFCAATSKQQGWSNTWDDDVIKVYFNVTGTIDESLIYNLHDSEISIIGYFGKNTDLAVPSSINVDGKNFPVTTIGDRAFSQCDSLITIIIPSSVTTIGDYAFSWCTSLTTIDIPSSVTTIGDYAFSGCTSLTTIDIPSSVTKIGNYTLKDCSSLTNIHYSATTIADYTFENCTSLTTIIIPSSVTTIGDYAFSGCTSLTTVFIPSSVTTIGISIFYHCIWMQITIYCEVSSKPNGWKDDLEEGEIVKWGNSINDCGFIYSVNNSEISIIAYVGTSKDVIIPPSLTIDNKEVPVTTIGNYAFSDCYLNTVNIPSSVTTIGSGAFYHSGLKTVNIPSSVTTIGNSVFCGCNLTTIDIPSSVTTIGNYAFSGCDLTTIDIPSSVMLPQLVIMHFLVVI